MGIHGLRVVFFDVNDTLYEYHGEQIRHVEEATFSLIPNLPLSNIWPAYLDVKKERMLITGVENYL